MRDARGYTVLELLVSTLVFSMVMGGAYMLLDQQQQMVEDQMSIMAVRQQARVPMKQMSQDLRMAGYNLNKKAPEAIIETTMTSVAIAADIDNGSPEIPCTSETPNFGGVERIIYRVDGDILRRSIDCLSGGGKWEPEVALQDLATGVVTSQPVFRYYTAEGLELIPGSTGLGVAERSAVRLIEVRLEVADTSHKRFIGKDEYPRSVLSSLISIRNLTMRAGG